MNYKVTRYEKIRNHDGDIVEIFLNIEVDNGEEKYNHGYWLTSEEIIAVLANSNAITAIAEDASSIGKTAQENYIATRPMPIIVEETENIIINPNNV